MMSANSSNLVDSICQDISRECMARSCNKEGCKLSLRGLASQKKLIDLDKPDAPTSENPKKCDYLLFTCDTTNQTLCVAAIEMKKGNAVASKMKSQLDAGADIAMKIVPQNQSSKFFPIAVYGGSLHKYQRNRFSDVSVNFHGKNYKIQLIRCERELASVLKC